MFKRAPELEALSAREKAYVAGLVGKMKKYHKTSSVRFIQNILGRVTREPTAAINTLVDSVAQEFAGTYKNLQEFPSKFHRRG